MRALNPGLRPRIATRARLQTDRVTGKPVLLYPEGVLMLNSTGQAVASLCDGASTFEQIVATLAARYKIPAEQVQTEAAEFLDRLRELNVLELVDAGTKL